MRAPASLNREEVARLLAEAKRQSTSDWLMILVAFLHGLRASEVTGLTEDAIADGCITVQRLKGSMKTTQPLLESDDELFDERAALLELAKKSKKGARLFPITRGAFRQRMRKHAIAAGIPKHKAHPHVLKHSIAMQTIREAGIENVRLYLGHKSIASTGAYLKPSEEEASSAIAGALAPRPADKPV